MINSDKKVSSNGFKMSEFLKVQNDFNEIILKKSTALEIKLLCQLLFVYQQHEGKEDSIKVSSTDLITAISPPSRRAHKEELIETVNNLKKHFFNLTIEWFRDNDPRKVRSEHLFSIFDCNYTDNSKQAIDSIEIVLNPHFKYLLDSMCKPFTLLSVLEIRAIKGKYSIMLYKILKEFRTTKDNNDARYAYYRVSYSELCKKLDVPPQYKPSDFTKRVLDPALKELSHEIKIGISDDATRIPFKDLTCEKVYGSGRGRPLKELIFRFKREPANKAELEELKKIEAMSPLEQEAMFK